MIWNDRRFARPCDDFRCLYMLFEAVVSKSGVLFNLKIIEPNMIVQLNRKLNVLRLYIFSNVKFFQKFEYIHFYKYTAVKCNFYRYW